MGQRTAPIGARRRLPGAPSASLHQRLSGHANTSQTLDTYSHVPPDMQDGAVAAMQDALS